MLFILTWLLATFCTAADKERSISVSETQTAEPEDEVTTAVQIAKAYVRKLWQGENIQNIGLEEITHEDGSVWRITIGFSRPWDRTNMGQLGLVFAQAPLARTYKSLLVDTKTKEVRSVSNRETDIRQ